jgi:hypothetical protein
MDRNCARWRSASHGNGVIPDTLVIVMWRYALVLALPFLIVRADAADKKIARIATGDQGIVECEPQRVHDNKYWSYREIDGRKCWYQGQPGKPKSQLRWPAAASKAAQRGAGPYRTDPVAVSARKGVMPHDNSRRGEPKPDKTKPAPSKEELAARALSADELLAATCCWPPLEGFALRWRQLLDDLAMPWWLDRTPIEQQQPWPKK